MVKFIDSERAVARWEICGIVVSLPHRRGRTNDEMHSILESYINTVTLKIRFIRMIIQIYVMLSKQLVDYLL